MKNRWTWISGAAIASGAMALSGCALEMDEPAEIVEEAEAALNINNIRLRNQGSNRCARAGAVIQNFFCGIASSYRWDIVQLPNNLHWIRSRANGRCMTVQEVFAGATVTLAPCNATHRTQQWRIAMPQAGTITMTIPGAQNMRGGAAGTPVMVAPWAAGNPLLRWDLVP